MRLSLPDDAAKVAAIYNYVKNNVTWNEFIDKVPDHPFKKVLEEKKGSSSEINLLMVSMLQKAGLEADPVLISTRSNGRIRPFTPMFGQFNDVICAVKLGEKRLLLDATERELPMTALPKRCLNGEGLLVAKEPQWIPITTSKTKTMISADVSISPDGIIEGAVDIVRDGHDAAEKRKVYTQLGEKDYIAKAFDGKNISIEKSAFINVTDAAQAMKEKYELNFAEHAQVAGGTIYLDPFLLGKIDENPFKSDKREYPVDFATGFDQTFLLKMAIPDNLTIDELPKPKVLALPGNAGRYSFNATLNGNVLNIVSQLAVNKAVFSSEEYPILKEFYHQIIAKQAEQIVLKKK